jgi:hypothetical protein
VLKRKIKKGKAPPRLAGAAAAAAAFGAAVLLGLGRIVALHYRSSTSYHIC